MLILSSYIVSQKNVKVDVKSFECLLPFAVLDIKHTLFTDYFVSKIFYLNIFYFNINICYYLVSNNLTNYGRRHLKVSCIFVIHCLHDFIDVFPSSMLLGKILKEPAERVKALCMGATVFFVSQ